jgi:DNA-binding response OmpR family regulator
MSYDGTLEEFLATHPRTHHQRGPTDLERIVTTLQLAAVYLTDAPGATFTRQQILDKVREVDPELAARDVEIVLANCGFLRRKQDKLSLK